MKDFPIPVVPFGAGSQPVDDEEFHYLPMPGAEPLRTPIPPENAAPTDLAAAAAVVEQLLEAMQRHRPGAGESPRFSVKAMAPGALAALNDSLGQGEVSAVVNGANGTPSWRAQETAFAGVMNAPAIVSEIRHHAQRFKPGTPAHVVNLSLLPLAPADHDGLAAVLGEGPVAILSRGFGNCRITATRARGVWRVRYFNSMNTMILDTIEVVDFPESARAGAEDYDDSVERLQDLLRWLREG